MSNELAEKFLKSAEELLEVTDSQERLLEVLDQAEQLLPDDLSILCRSAELLFRYGVLNGKVHFYLLALDKLKTAEEKNPLFFDQLIFWTQLWGNILIQLGKRINSSSFFELAIQKYERAEKAEEEPSSELYWDMGEAWILLGQNSREPTDFQKGLIYFSKAHNLGIHSFFFYLDYAHAFFLYGQLTGSPDLLEESILLYRTVIAHAYSPDKEPSIAYTLGWRKLALAMKERFFLTHSREHFKEADTVFRDAILSAPKNGELWLDWGELFLKAGWSMRDVKLIEDGLEKLTSSKIKECDPIGASRLLGMGLVIFGLFTENFKLMKNGQKRIQSALTIVPESIPLKIASAFAESALGIYFSDERAYASAASILEQVRDENNFSIDCLEFLFQNYVAWGAHEADSASLSKALHLIAHLSALRPYSPCYLNEWGMTLLHFRKLECDKEKNQALLEEAIDKFKKAAALSDEVETLHHWGYALTLLGDLTANEEEYTQSIDLLSQAFERKPTELAIRHHLGLAFAHLGTLTLNVECLIQAVGLLEPISKVTQEDPDIFCDLGYVLLHLSDLIFDPLNPEAGERKRQEAESALNRAIALGDEESYYYLAAIHSLSGRYELSLYYLKKAAEIDCLPPAEDLLNDEWFEAIRSMEAFQEIVRRQHEND